MCIKKSEQINIVTAFTADNFHEEIKIMRHRLRPVVADSKSRAGFDENILKTTKELEILKSRPPALSSKLLKSGTGEHNPCT